MTNAEIVDILHEAKANLREQYDNKVGCVVDHKLKPYEDVINDMQRLIDHFKKPKKPQCSFWADGEHHWQQGHNGLLKCECGTMTPKVVFDPYVG